MIKGKPLTQSYSLEEYQEMVVRSSLWAAAGDALGWITELSRGSEGVQYRSGRKFISEPIKWKRKIGGRFGTSIDLPAGTYSDDTQLRLSVGRAIRGNGAFDVEAFAKIELPVWQSYALGAGIGSMAAAANLSKRNVNWFSNFFHTKKQQYTNAGGNGAAMRIQPHVWSSSNSIEQLLTQVLRDSLVTHGHPHGFCGAVFHALCLHGVISGREIPSIDQAFAYLEIMDIIPSLINKDNELSTFWKGHWETEAKINFEASLAQFKKEAFVDIDQVVNAFNKGRQTNYNEILRLLGCLTPRFRGSGFKTALAAFALAVMHKDKSIEDALVLSANELESDTDTIATMAGALLGAVSDYRPKWAIQDKEYLISDAIRLAMIAFRENQTSFGYPDLSTWNAPTNQSDAVVAVGKGRMALAGLGELKPISEEIIYKNFIWQWFRLPHGQSILAKRRKSNISSMYQSQMPTERLMPIQNNVSVSSKHQGNLQFGENHRKQAPLSHRDENKNYTQRDVFPGINSATQEVINSGFDDKVLGYFLNLCIEDTGQIEAAVAFSAIIAKAKLARKHRHRR